MRLFVAFSALLMGTSAAFAAPLDRLSERQSTTLGQLYVGFSGGVICGRKIDMGVASRFLESKLADLKITPSQLAEVSFMVLSIHAAEIGMLMKQQPVKQQPASEAIPNHCKEVDRAYGPVGRIIPGLLGAELPRNQ